jgi:hypothetical protein
MPQAQQPTRKNSCISRGLNASESYEEFDELAAAFLRDANPRDIIERTYVTDAVYLTWEIRQYRQLKAKIMTLSYHDELQTVVYHSLFDAKIEAMAKAADIDGANSDEPQKDADEIDSETLREMRQQCRQQGREIADRWSASDEGPSEVSKLSLEHGFDEFELEMSVFEECQDQIEGIDRSLAMLENRWMAAIRFLGEYRETFARKVRAVSDKLIENGAPDPQRITK